MNKEIILYGLLKNGSTGAQPTKSPPCEVRITEGIVTDAMTKVNARVAAAVSVTAVGSVE